KARDRACANPGALLVRVAEVPLCREASARDRPRSALRCFGEGERTDLEEATVWALALVARARKATQAQLVASLGAHEGAEGRAARRISERGNDRDPAAVDVKFDAVVGVSVLGAQHDDELAGLREARGEVEFDAFDPLVAFALASAWEAKSA